MLLKGLLGCYDVSTSEQLRMIRGIVVSYSGLQTPEHEGTTVDKRKHLGIPEHSDSIAFALRRLNNDDASAAQLIVVSMK